MSPMAKWSQIMEGNTAHILIAGNIPLDVMVVIYNAVLFHWYI